MAGGGGGVGWKGKLCHTIGQAGGVSGVGGGVDGRENFVTRLVELQVCQSGWRWMEGKTLSHNWSSWRCVSRGGGGWKGKLCYTTGRAGGVSGIGGGVDGRESFVTRLVGRAGGVSVGVGVDGRKNFVTRLVGRAGGVSVGVGVDGRKNFVTRLVELQVCQSGWGWMEGKTLSHDWSSWKSYISHWSWGGGGGGQKGKLCHTIGEAGDSKAVMGGQGQKGRLWIRL